MPELPEMQALAERLDELLRGAKVKRVLPLSFSSLRTYDPPATDLEGMILQQVTKRGKYLVFRFEGAQLLVHLSQSGRVDVEPTPKATKPKGAVARFIFDDRPALLIKEFGTERKVAWWVLPLGEDGPLHDLGPEAGSEEYDRWVMTGTDNRRLNTALRDQRTVAGIGRGFSDDILHAARVSPFAKLSGLTEEERRRLVEATERVIEEALKKERKRTGGLPAKLGDRFTVHRRFGQPCPRCETTLERVSYESHEIVYCPECQTEGKILADRRMSRLLR
ncbi:MAG: DNA-formamidopyrimidine glycosylase family protein [Actinomycetota bacterium]